MGRGGPVMEANPWAPDPVQTGPQGGWGRSARSIDASEPRKSDLESESDPRPLGDRLEIGMKSEKSEPQRTRAMLLTSNEMEKRPLVGWMVDFWAEAFEG